MKSNYVTKNIESFLPFKSVQSRELKTLLNHENFQGDRTECFAAAWDVIKKASIASGFDIIDAENPFEEVCKVQEYFDTKLFEVRKNGVVLRKSTKFKGDDIEPESTLTAKDLNKNLFKVLASKLDFADGFIGETEIEEKVAFNSDNQLDGYFEVQKKLKVNNNFDGSVLSNFATIFPYINSFELQKDTPMNNAKLFSYRVYPGFIKITPNQIVKFDIEACSLEKGSKPFVVGCSFTIETSDYYNMDEDHFRAEKFLTEVLEDKCQHLLLPNGRKWLGSKLKILLSLQ